MGARIRDSHNVGDDLLFAQTFKVSKEKYFVLFDRAADAGAELILVKRRRFRRLMAGLDYRTTACAFTLYVYTSLR